MSGNTNSYTTRNNRGENRIQNTNEQDNFDIRPDERLCKLFVSKKLTFYISCNKIITNKFIEALIRKST